jgi:hypothetical protein
VATSKRVREVVEKFVSELQDLFLADLIESVAGTKLASLSAGRTKALKRGEKRTPAALGQLADKLHSYISKHPGQRIEQIAFGMGMTTKELNLPAKKLIAEKRLTTKGAKRATTYTAR